MSKKIILFFIVILIFLGGLFWYDYRTDFFKQSASILTQNNDTQNLNKTILNNEIILGNPNAPVTMIEYAKYSCPHCADFQNENFSKLMSDYIRTGKVKYIARRVSPLDLSAIAFCADKQNKFQKVDNYLFENVPLLYQKISGLQNQKEIENIFSQWLLKIFEEVDLDEDQFQKCLNSQESQNIVKYWFNQAKNNNVDATPSFFINSQKFTGNKSYSELKTIIEEALNDDQNY